MRRGHTRLAIPALLLLLSVACTSNEREGNAAPAEPQVEQTTPETGTEAALTPVDPAPPPTSDAVAAETSDRPAAPAASRTERPAARPAPTPPTSAAPARSASPQAAANATPSADEGRDSPVPARESPRDVTRPDLAPRPIPVRMVSIPAETNLPLVLQSDIASDTSSVEDRVSARVARDVVVDNEVVIPEGSRVAGRVTYAQPSARVKGRAGLTVRFHSLTIGSRTYDIAAAPVRREAAGTKARDVRDIGIGAGAGAVIGGIIGGRKGAGIGAAVGGAGGAGKVLATSGEEVRLPAGTSVTTSLSEPLVVQADGTR